MINHKYKCIFVHIPKTAGSSIRRILPESEEPKFIGGHATATNMYGFFRNNFPEKQKSIIVLGEKKWDEYFKFAFVRNPWDRFVSAYNFLKGGGNKNEESLTIKHDLMDKHSGFKEFVCNEVLEDSDVLNGECPLPSGKYRVYHFKSQFEIICNSKKDRLLINNIYNFEQLQHGVDDIFKKTGIPQKPLLHLKKSIKTKPYTEYYDDETRKIIAFKYKKDIEHFNYKFGD